jgi:hypothetical protein
MNERMQGNQGGREAVFFFTYIVVAWQRHAESEGNIYGEGKTEGV